ncbi:Glycine-zipper containing OmpA-like membrane domain-containing protein [Nitrosomonas sp. PY1]|uniref:glycine zipper family protein n=1 Tax=Nitrosomonas sp. PY1 TaxID=1803906 RepID=UPI001FC7FDC9|nr:glycine zipper family protein [Nitrosomonas sp. PY1]GKS68065.1 Glycine-zipper containing OmpA-like membrane domain-containing protein [Nitrosomonas sp. PY1]
MKSIITLGVALILLLWLSGCANTKPILYPNAHYNSVGREAAEADVEACRRLAESAGASEDSSDSAAGRVATSTAMGAGMGAAGGAVGGAISGGAGHGSLIGAASGAAIGLLRGIFFAARPSQPNPAYVNFVYQCLQEKGYSVTGWQ